MTPSLVARSEHRQHRPLQGGQPRGQRPGEQSSSHPQQQPDLGVRGLAVLGDVERHRVLVPVDEHQANRSETVAKTAHRPEQRRAVATEDDREPVCEHRCTDPLAQRVDHRQQGRLVDQRRCGATLRRGGRQLEISRIDDSMTREALGQAVVTEHASRRGLVPRAAVSIERDADQLDIDHVPRALPCVRHLCEWRVIDVVHCRGA